MTRNRQWIVLSLSLLLLGGLLMAYKVVRLGFPLTSNDSGEQWVVQPLSKLTAEPVQPGLHVVYRGDDVVLSGPYSCGTDDIEQPFRNIDRGTEAGGDSGGGIADTGYVICEIACDADVEFYNWNGGSVVDTIKVDGLPPHGMTIHDGDLWYCDADTCQVCRIVR